MVANALWLRNAWRFSCRVATRHFCQSVHVENGDTSPQLLQIGRRGEWLTVESIPSIDQLFSCRVHYGHKRNLRNPWMRPYIFGSRINMDIINLALTRKLMVEAFTFLANIVYRGGMVLFVCCHPQHVLLVERQAKACQEYAHCRSWQGGTLVDSTNFFGTMIRHPDVIILLHTLVPFGQQHPVVIEASKVLIPTIALVDTDTDPSLVTYPIPANDDSVQSVSLFTHLFGSCILQAKQLQLEASNNNTAIRRGCHDEPSEDCLNRTDL